MLSKISFRYIHAMDTCPNVFCAEPNFEIINTIFPHNDAQLKAQFKEILKIPKMSTLAIGAYINQTVANLKPDESFVNVGIWCGFSYFSGMSNNPEKHCIGIDNFSEFEGNGKDIFFSYFNSHKSAEHLFFQMDYQDYFATKHQSKIGFYIYDGDHSYQHQLKGLQVAEPFFSDDCIILVDDTNAPDPYNATLDFIEQSKNNYEIIFNQKTAANSHPTFWNGLLIFQRK